MYSSLTCEKQRMNGSNDISVGWDATRLWLEETLCRLSPVLSPYSGTYPGAALGVKEDATTSQQQKALPNSITIPITDFPTSVLLAAANQVFSGHGNVKEVLQSVSRQVTLTPTTVVVATSPSSTVNTLAVTSQSSPFSYGSVPSSPAGAATAASSSPSHTSSFDDSSFLTQDSQYTDMKIEDDVAGSPRSHHMSAEKKRRINIKTPGQQQKSGFDLLNTIIPSLSQNPNAKVSKAAMLQKTAEYCKKLKSERSQMQHEADILKQEINALNQAISICQSQLPATGVPVTRQRANEMKEMFEEYVKQRTLTNWKFWIFSLVIRNLFDSYNTMVSTASVDELCRTVLAWLDQHCSLPSLRPIAAKAMTHLSTTTSILSDPSRVPEQAAQAVIKKQRHRSGDT